MAKLKQKFLTTDGTSTSQYISDGNGSIIMIDKLDNYKREFFKVDETILNNKYIDVSNIILDALKHRTHLILDGTIHAIYGEDFTILENAESNLVRVSWEGFPLENELTLGDSIQINYPYIGSSYNIDEVQTFTMQNTDINSKQIQLKRPINKLYKNYTHMYISNGPLLLYPYDFDLQNDSNDLLSIVSWNGFDLENVLEIDDVLNIHYKIGN